MRQVHAGEDLSGQTLDARRTDARESLFDNCVLDGATFLGDWRGADYLRCRCVGTDWTGAETHSSYWEGCTLTDARFPADLGYLHREPVAELIRQAASRVTGVSRGIALALPAWLLSDPDRNSWATAWDDLISKISGATKTRSRSLLRVACEGYPLLLERNAEVEQAEDAGGVLWTPPPDPRKQEVAWHDGATVNVDADALPSLPDRSRYSLARWIEAEADRQAPGPHHCFVYSIRSMSMMVKTFERPDGWVAKRHGGA